MIHHAPSFSIIIADDHTLVRHDIKTILDESDRYEVIGETEDANATTQLVETLRPDILLLDIELPAKTGIEVIYELKERGVPLTIVVLTTHEDELMVKQALAAGAMGYVLKDFTPEELIATLDRVMDGEKVVPPQFQHIIDELDKKNSTPHTSNDLPLDKLSKREREVYLLLAAGLPNRAIAKKLFISSRTVEAHLARVLKKLGFKSTTELIRSGTKK